MTESVIMTRSCDLMELTVLSPELTRLDGMPRVAAGELSRADELAEPHQAVQES
jgi:hypothetical protein